MEEAMVSADWLKQHMDDPNLVILAASQQSKQMGITAEIGQVQIPGARVFDLKGEFSLKSTHLPHMLPDPGQFEQACRKLGINDTSKIVVYDELGVYFSPRVWWMFKTMGHHDIAVLNGGLPEWIAKGHGTEAKKLSKYSKGNFSASFSRNAVASIEDIQKNIAKQDSLLIDARSAGRFKGTEPEPRKGLPSGSIQNAVNLPYEKVLENGKFKSKEELVQVFKDLPIDRRPLIFSCGSGITACIVLMASELVCRNDKSVYDGSWTEWAERNQKAEGSNPG